MFTEFIPQCPRGVHPGMMILDDSQVYGQEWVCRVCATRLYGTDPESAAPARVSSEIPIKDDARTGRPRNIPTRYKYSKDRGGRGNTGGKWYE